MRYNSLLKHQGVILDYMVPPSWLMESVDDSDDNQRSLRRGVRPDVRHDRTHQIQRGNHRQQPRSVGENPGYQSSQTGSSIRDGNQVGGKLGRYPSRRGAYINVVSTFLTLVVKPR